MEQWKLFEERTNKLYYISSLGNVKAITKANGAVRYVKQYNHSGYSRIQLNNPKKHYLVHRLVAEAFIPNPSNKPEVNHIVPIIHGGTNAIDNLEWCTNKENIEHATKLGLYVKIKSP